VVVFITQLMKWRMQPGEEIVVGENSTGGIGRREAIKLGAKAAGVTAFAAPVVVGVFSAPAVGQTTVSCNGETDSDAVYGTVDSGGSWNSNCGGSGPYGRYNAQDAHFTFAGGDGTVVLGAPGTDNIDVEKAYYNVNVTGWVCTVTWLLENCDFALGTSTPQAPGLPVPYCPGNCNSVRLAIDEVVCCPA
jgi:hypothetical protein